MADSEIKSAENEVDEVEVEEVLESEKEEIEEIKTEARGEEILEDEGEEERKLFCDFFEEENGKLICLFTISFLKDSSDSREKG